MDPIICAPTYALAGGLNMPHDAHKVMAYMEKLLACGLLDSLYQFLVQNKELFLKVPLKFRL